MRRETEVIDPRVLERRHRGVGSGVDKLACDLARGEYMYACILCNILLL